jgi:O-acetylserine/cysteine efflux transporter
MKPQHYLLATLVVVLWGLNTVISKVGVSEISPFFMITMRFICVAAILVPFFPLPRGMFWPMLRIALVFGIGHFGLLFFGMKGIDASATAIALQLGPPFSALIAWIFLKDKLDRVRWAGMILAFTGVIFLAGEPERIEVWSFLSVCLCALAWAVGNMQVQRVDKLHPLCITAWMTLLASPFLIVITLVFESNHLQQIENFSWTAAGALVYVVFGASIISHSSWYFLLKTYPLNLVVPFSLLGPIIGVIGGVILLNEPFSLQKGFGSVLTISGVAIMQLYGQRRSKQNSANTDHQNEHAFKK